MGWKWIGGGLASVLLNRNCLSIVENSRTTVAAAVHQQLRPRGVSSLLVVTGLCPFTFLIGVVWLRWGVDVLLCGGDVLIHCWRATLMK